MNFLFPDGDDDEPRHECDIDKSWQGLHYLLTGKAFGGEKPLALAVMGGAPLSEDMDEVPACFLPPDDVRQVAGALARLTPDMLAQRFNPQDMDAQQIYPDGIWVREGQEALDYLLDGFATLQQFYAGAAGRGDAVIVTIG